MREIHDDEFDAVLDEIRPLPGAAALLRELRDRGFKVVLASSGAAEQTRRLLELVDGDELAHHRTSSADVEESKPAPDLIDAAVESVGGRRAVVIGDAVWDFVPARERGHHGIGLLSGGFGEDELRAAGADQVFATRQDLLDALDETPLRNRGHRPG